MLHDQAFIREYRGEIGELHALAQLCDRRAVDAFDLLQGRVLFVRTGGANRSFDVVALAQAVAADHRQTHVHIVLPRQITACAQEAIPIGKDIEHACGLDEAFGLHARIEHRVDKLGLLEALVIDAQLIGLFAEFGDLELLKIFARGLRDDRLAMVVIAMLAALATMVVIVLLALVLLIVLLIIATVVSIAVVSIAVALATNERSPDGLANAS